MEAPLGTITFLFTDIEGSSRLWERFPVDMGVALARHDAMMRGAIEKSSGFVFKTVGDAFCIAFATAGHALRAAVEAQTALFNEPWGETGPLRVRMALHTGVAEFRDGDYFGPALNRVARVMGAGHGGQVLLTYSTAELVRDDLPPGVVLRDLGERRLRDLSRPEHVFQLVVEGLPADFPPLRSLEAMPNNLPVQLTSFIGREKEMAEAKRLLGETHLLTLIGTGGTGKTRLSLQLAAEALEGFSDGVWFVELALISDPAQVIVATAGALGVREEPERPLLETLANFLRAKNLLLIFDNCEHVVAACARLVESLLRAASHLRVLATSRHSLGIAGETILPIPPLSMPNLFRERISGPDAVEVISQFEAVKLFIDRAIAVNPNFEVTNANAPDVAEICWRLDGIPLALELAAARVKVLSPKQIAQRLNDRFRLLTGGSRNALPRQQTLRALIDWSIDLLSEPEKLLLRRLGVFAGGRSMAAVEEVCSGNGVEDWEVLDLLTQLVDKSLLAVETGPDGSIRYTMTESVWQYTREKLEESGELAEMRDRHLEYFLRKAEDIQPKLVGPEQAMWIERLDVERINVRQAMEWSLKSPGKVRTGLRLASALIRLWEVRSNLREGHDQLEALVKHPDNSARDSLRAWGLHAFGRMAWTRDENESAAACFREAGEIFKELGDREHAALLDVYVGFIERSLENLDRAEELIRAALAVGRELSSKIVIATASSGLGSVIADRGDHGRALELKQESIAVYRSLGDKWIIGLLLWGVARESTFLGLREDAREALIEWAGIVRELRNKWTLPYLLQTFGDLGILEGHYHRAALLFGASAGLYEQMGFTMMPLEQRALNESLAKLRANLTDVEFRQAWENGKVMRPWAALELAVQES
jgi:predicted ATPase/class 3 adenylate cyclase